MHAPYHANLSTMQTKKARLCIPLYKLEVLIEHACMPHACSPACDLNSAIYGTSESIGYVLYICYIQRQCNHMHAYIRKNT